MAEPKLSLSELEPRSIETGSEAVCFQNAHMNPISRVSSPKSQRPGKWRFPRSFSRVTTWAQHMVQVSKKMITIWYCNYSFICSSVLSPQCPQINCKWHRFSIRIFDQSVWGTVGNCHPFCKYWTNVLSRQPLRTLAAHKYLSRSRKKVHSCRLMSLDLSSRVLNKRDLRGVSLFSSTAMSWYGKGSKRKCLRT